MPVYEILQIHKEIVSGETISARPVMLQLLDEVSKGMWDGVLVMEVERLARGDTMDQGFVSQTFRYTNTKIVTPMKVYDPSNEFDQEYFEFGLFMSRREYITINRRLQRGRLASVGEGKFCGSISPFGYEKVKIPNDKGYTLEPIEDEANAVRLIYQLYTEGELQPDGVYRKLGVTLIAKKLNDLHIHPKKKAYWTAPAIREILKNPVYIGKVRWNWRQTKKAMVDGKRTSSRPRSKEEECLSYDGRHPAIIKKEVFDAAQEIMKEHSIPAVNINHTVKNPLAGIVICGKCGHNMVRRPYPVGKYEDTLICSDIKCDNISSVLRIVEQHLLDGLRKWVSDYKLTLDNRNDASVLSPSVEILENQYQKLRKEKEGLEKQRNKAFDLVEQGIYDHATFLERSRTLSDKIKELEEGITKTNKEIRTEKARETARKTIVPKIEQLLTVYDTLPTPKAKNDMLNEVLEKAEYIKTIRRKRNESEDTFELTLYPKIPKTEGTDE